MSSKAQEVALDRLLVDRFKSGDAAAFDELTSVDYVGHMSGVPDFVTAWNARLEHGVRDRVVPFLGRAELVATKRASGRPKDLADLHALGEADEE